MSRSTKKPYYKDHTPGGKRLANKSVRRKGKKDPEETANGKAYRKEYDTWAVSDWTFHAPKDKKAHRK